MRKYLLALFALAASSVFAQTVTTNPALTGIASGSVVNGQAITPLSVTASGTVTAADFYGNGSHLTGISAGRMVLAADKTFYVRTPAHAVTFASGSANIGWASHGLSVNDPVVLAVAPNTGAATVTIASPAVVSKTAHGYLAGQPLRWDTTGALPTGLDSTTTVYVLAAGLAADSFEVSLTPGGAAINTSGTQSGTHYVSQVGALPTFSTAGALGVGTVYYVKTVPGANSVTLSTTPSGTALGTATLATGSPVYTAGTGNDANDCSAADRAHACLTAQHALDTLARSYDLGSNHALTSAVQLADGTYAENLFFYEPVGSGASLLSSSFSNAPTYSSTQFLGNASNASNVVIAPTDLSNVIALNISGGSWVFSGFTVDSTTSGGYMVMAAGAKAYAEFLTSLRLIAGSGAVGITAQDGAVIRLAGNLDLTMTGPFGYGFQVFNGSYVDAESQYVHLLNAPSFSDFAYLNNRGAMTFYSSIVGTATGQRFYLQGNSTVYTFGSGATFMPGNAAGFGEPGTFYDGLQGATSGNDSAAATFVGEYGSTCVTSGAAVTLTNVTTANVGTVTLAHGGDYDFEGNINFIGTAATVTGGQGAISTTSATLPTDGSEVYDGTVTTTLTDTSGIALPRKRVSLNAGASVFFVAQKTFSAGTEKAFGCLNWRRVR